jgi:hypothetical protein
MNMLYKKMRHLAMLALTFNNPIVQNPGSTHSSKQEHLTMDTINRKWMYK